MDQPASASGDSGCPWRLYRAAFQHILAIVHRQGLISAYAADVEPVDIAVVARFNRKRTGKKLSNLHWQSTTDPDSRMTRMKDGATYLAYKSEHAVDLASGALLATKSHAAGYNLGLVMRHLYRYDTPPGRWLVCLFACFGLLGAHIARYSRISRYGHDSSSGWSFQVLVWLGARCRDGNWQTRGFFNGLLEASSFYCVFCISGAHRNELYQLRGQDVDFLTVRFVCFGKK